MKFGFDWPSCSEKILLIVPGTTDGGTQEHDQPISSSVEPSAKVKAKNA